MAVVVLIHGIGQEQKSADTLEDEWLPDLAGGLRFAGFAELADRLWRNRATPAGIEAGMAFYGYLFLTPDQQGAAAEPHSPQAKAMADALAEEWLTRAATRGSGGNTRLTAERELAFVRGEMGEEMGAGAVARHAVNGLAKVRWFAPFGAGFAARFVWRSLAQVTTYMTDDAVRSAALDRVAALVGPETE